ncbi:sigma-70 family RNA polymerase sigma factor [Marinobacter sp. S6332]|uniref:sigma-70 family RNA polymerase sigma factor n=1 Tax=Marinobacter sp. S6332 TaxID=2926403 RepID=UPI001FF57047|nr:sigma-70 family RNA polymerase sigma factor [Marinobacter sp. S6332]MCK0164836.1 sigma-70 family RNA polymerase sigma factor [Marinobacter sp. S6332]
MPSDYPTPTAESRSTDSSVPQAATANDISALIGSVAMQDRAAFAKLYTATAPKLLGVVLRILKERSWADDVIQEAYLKVWQRAGQFDSGKASPITWLVSIARNKAIDELRKHPAGRTSTDDAMDERVSRQPTAQDQMEDQQEVSKLNRCIDELAKERQDIVRLAYLGGWSREELANQYEQPVNTMKTWLRRALQDIKGCLES